MRQSCTTFLDVSIKNYFGDILCKILDFKIYKIGKDTIISLLDLIE